VVYLQENSKSKFKSKFENEQEMEKLRNSYYEWRNYKKKINSPFFLIYNDFKDEHLKTMSGGSLKLFLYFGFHVNNKTGECWHSIESIADFFGVDQRTVNKWVFELEQRQLIKRIQRGYKWVSNTFMLPYGTEGEEDLNE